MPTYGDNPYLRTLVAGQTGEEIPLDKPGVQPILCGFTAPCGRADVVVVHHPLASVTGEDGTFRIEGVPAGEKFNLNAWHPLFEASRIEVTVAPGETKTVELVIKPAPDRVEQPAAATPKEAAPKKAAPADKNDKGPAKPEIVAPD